jgi:hypothetical protein
MLAEQRERERIMAEQRERERERLAAEMRERVLQVASGSPVQSHSNVMIDLKGPISLIGEIHMSSPNPVGRRGVFYSFK